MDVKLAASQLIDALSANPDLVSQLAQHPYSTTAQVTGTDETISKDDMSQVLTQIAAQINNQGLGSNDTANVASMLMSQSGNSAHSLANMLFGGAANTAAAPTTQTSSAGSTGPSMQDILIKSIVGGLVARGAAAMITGALGTSKVPTAGSTTTSNAAPSNSIDFAALAEIAKNFKK